MRLFLSCISLLLVICAAMAGTDYYSVLGVSRKATAAELKKVMFSKYVEYILISMSGIQKT
jgi:hypothetical protein